MTEHPLRRILERAAGESFPPADGGVDVLSPDEAGTRAVVAFSGHAYVLADVDPAALTALGADGFGGASKPDVLQAVAGPDHEIGSLDVVLVTTGGDGERLERRHDLDHHSRVLRAAHHRRDVEVYGDDVGFVIVGRGLVDRRELSVELIDPAIRRAWRGPPADPGRAGRDSTGRVVLGPGGSGQRRVTARVPRLRLRPGLLRGPHHLASEALTYPRLSRTPSGTEALGYTKTSDQVVSVRWVTPGTWRNW